MLSGIHALTIPTLLVIFGMGVQHFADHYNTLRYIRCINNEYIKCSVVEHCSTTSNQTDCCMNSMTECITNNSLLQKMNIITVYCIAIGIVLFATSWMHASIFRCIGNSQMMKIRKKLFRSLVNQDITWFDVNESKEITSRMTE